MTTVYPLVQVITNLTVLAPVLSPWETCALKFVMQDRPASVSFICKTAQHCPINSLYKQLKTPTQTIFGLNTNELPFFHENDIVFLLDDNVTWNDEVVTKYRLWGWNNFKLVVVANRRKLDDDLRSMKDLFAAMWLSGIVRCAVLLVNDTSTQTYTYVPFKNYASCGDTSPVLIGDCSKGVGKMFDLADKVLNLNGCSLRVATVNGIPTFQNGSRGQVKMNAGLIQEIVKKMNASIKPVSPDTGSYGEVCGPNERIGVRGMVLNGTADMALERFTLKDCSILAYIGVGHMSCLSWCTPILSASDYVYFFLLKQLTPEVWIAVVLSVLTVSVSVFLLCAASLEEWTANDIFNLALTIYAQPTPAKPLATPARIVVVVWLWACLIIRAAYEGELKSQSAVPLDTHIIHDLEELSNTDILLYSSPSEFNIIKEINNPIMEKISKKINNHDENGYNMVVKAARQKDRGVLVPVDSCLSVGSDLRDNGAVLYPKTGGCFKTFEMTSIPVVRGSPFKSRWRILSLRCFQAGLITKWLDIGESERYIAAPRPFSLGHLFPAMFVLVVGCIAGLLLFIGEKTFYKWSQQRKR